MRLHPPACRIALAALLLGTLPAAAAEIWPDYQIIEWQPRNPAQLSALKRIGVDAVAVIADRGDGLGKPLAELTAPLRQAGLRWYLENIATDFYSPYHRWTPGKPVNWHYVELQKSFRANHDDPALLLRDPSLVDPVWQERIDARLTAIVRQQSPNHPLFYSLGDETGIADLSAYWDFDFSPASLAGMRAWLRTQYFSLAALNAEWGAAFTHWNDVRPPTTREAMRRTDGNYAAWSDFKNWMDICFAVALRRGTDTVHAADPHALAAIEGAQMPGWGGYDYTHLAHAVDLMEVYDSGENLSILHSLNPQLITLTTSFGAQPDDIHDIWRELLRGTRGLVLWDSDNSIVQPDGTLEQRGLIYAALFNELHRIAPLIMHATPHTDPIAILYSPASFRVQWMLDHQPKGDAWADRSAEQEDEDNRFRVAMRDYVESLQRLGLRPRFVSAAMLPGLNAKLLILPDTLALSAEDAAAITTFAQHGGMVIADAQPGSFDGHGKRLPAPALAPDVARIVTPTDRAALASMLDAVHVAPLVSVAADDDDIDLYTYQARNGTIVALQRRKPGHNDERATLTLPRALLVTNLRSGKLLGQTARLDLMVEPVAPTLLLLSSPRPLPHAPPRAVTRRH